MFNQPFSWSDYEVNAKKIMQFNNDLVKIVRLELWFNPYGEYILGRFLP